MTNTVCILEKNALTKEGLKALLDEEGYQIIGDFKSLEDLHPAVEHQSCTLFIIGEISDTPKPETTIKTVKDTFPQSYIVTLAGCSRLETICAAFAAGTDGYLMNDTPPSALKKSLQLILLGEKVLPGCFATELTRYTIGLNNPTPVSVQGFSMREQEIIKKLVSGASNKMIANDLDIAEATVKVHIKKILKQLGVSNRTQIAIWALNNGYEDEQLPDLKIV
ncbi:MAG: LuxR C-terminal-related transcriptional regulator [Pseudomonadota bacterium]